MDFEISYGCSLGVGFGVLVPTPLAPPLPSAPCQRLLHIKQLGPGVAPLNVRNYGVETWGDSTTRLHMCVCVFVCAHKLVYGVIIMNTK